MPGLRDLAVHEGAGREPFTGLGNARELVCEKVSSPRPDGDGISPSKAAVSVKFDLVEPVLTLGQLVDQSRIHRLNEADFGGRQRAKGFGCHRSVNGTVRVVQRLT